MKAFGNAWPRAIPAQGQIVVFVYQSDVEPEGAGGAVMAIDAAAIDGGSKRGDGGIVFLEIEEVDAFVDRQAICFLDFEFACLLQISPA